MQTGAEEWPLATSRYPSTSRSCTSHHCSSARPRTMLPSGMGRPSNKRTTRRPTPFNLRPVWMAPPLTKTIPAAPALTDANALTSLKTRVLQPLVHPSQPLLRQLSHLIQWTSIPRKRLNRLLTRDRELTSPERESSAAHLAELIEQALTHRLARNRNQSQCGSRKHNRHKENDDLVSLFMTDMGIHRNVGPLSPQELSLRYPEHRRAQLLQAAELPAEASDSRVTCFVKYEAGFTDPRNITPRRDRYRMRLGVYISAFEHTARQWVCRLTNNPWLIKGLTQDEKDALLTKTTLRGTARYAETDYSRYDSTIVNLLMAVRNEVLLRGCRDNESGELRAMLNMQYSVRGSCYGFKFKSTSAGLGSGDPTTSIGNCITTGFQSWLCRLIYDWVLDVVHEGDDGLLTLSNDHPPNASELITEISSLCGTCLKVSIDSLERVSFVGRWLTTDNEGNVVSMCDLNRTLPKLPLTMSYRKGQKIERLKGLLIAKAMSYHMTDSRTPIVNAWIRAVYNTYPDATPYWGDKDSKWRWEAGYAHRPNPRERKRLSPKHCLTVLTALRAGIGVDTQTSFEAQLLRVDEYHDTLMMPLVKSKRNADDHIYLGDIHGDLHVG